MSLDLSALTPEQKDELRQRLEQRKQYEAASEEERKRIQERAALESDFSAFVKAAWHVVQPGVTLDWSWHYDLIGEYLTLVYERKIRRLIINISPRTLKSILVSVMFPVWVWTKRPGHGFACASYAANLSTEHSVMRRSLIESDWFKQRWGDRIWLAKDQNEKTKFKNNHQAQMIATSVGGTATGLGGNTLILDDGMNPKQAASDADTLTAHKWFDETWRSRLNNPAEDSLIVMEQRTSERDITGHCIEADEVLKKEGKSAEWTHLAIPLECDEESGPETWVYPISGKVKERFVGDVLQPNRFPPSVVTAWKVRRLVWSTQYQQRPSPLEGNMIKRSEVQYYGGRDPLTGELDVILPTKFDLIVTSADCAFKDEKHSDYVCIGTVGVVGPRRYVLEVVNKHLDEPATETEILRQRNKWGSSVVLVEDKANGPAVIKKLKRKISGVIAIEPEGGKMSRMFASCGEWQSGDWYLDRNAAWCEPFVEQVTKFPGAKNDDMADFMTQTCIYLQKQTYVYGLTEYLKSKDADMKRKQREGKDKVANEPLVHQTVLDQIAKVDHVDGIAKIDTDDSTERCPQCQSTLVQNRGGGKRCGQCGAQWNMPALVTKPNNFGNMGIFRK